MALVSAATATASCQTLLHHILSRLDTFASPLPLLDGFQGFRNVLGCPRCRRFSIRCKNEQSRAEAIEKKERTPTRQRSLKQQLKRRALAHYRSRFAAALDAELTEEMEKIKERLRKWSREKLEAEGVALFDLSVRSEGILYRDRIVRFYKSSGDGILPPRNQFTQGDIVLISKKHPLDDEQDVLEGVVMERARRFVKVAISFNQSRDLGVSTKWRLDLSANRVAYERSLFAVDIFSSPLVHQQGAVSHLASTGELNGRDFGWSSEGPILFGEGVTAIRGLIMKFEEEKFQLLLQQEEASAIQREDIMGFHSLQCFESSDETQIPRNPPSQIGGKSLGAIKGSIRAYLQGVGEELNISQKLAIETAACQKVTLWQGPPGTGKTRTLTHLIVALCKSRGKVMACADSNVAVDNLVEGLLKLGLQVVRVGQPVKVKEELRACTVDALVAEHRLMNRATNMKKKATEQRMRSRQANNSTRRATGAEQAKSMRDEAEELKARALKDVFDRADVVAATCIGAGDLVLTNCSFRVCVIDEATQATEPASLVPILRSGADCIVLVGDPAQLPPTILSSTALEAGLDNSLFQHLQECGLRPCFLDTQYRMHPAIAALPSALFYSGRLKSHPLPSDRLAPNGLVLSVTLMELSLFSTDRFSS